MRILAIDTSAQFVSVSLLDQDRVIFELDSRRVSENADLTTAGKAGSADVMANGYTKKRSKRGSKTSRVFPPGASVLLAPMIKSVLDTANQKIAQIGLIALATGPGRFTGLRVAVVTAKALAYSTKSEIIGVNTLEVIAAQTANSILSDHRSPNNTNEKISIRPVINAQRQQLFCGNYRPVSPWKVAPIAPNQILDRETWINEMCSGDIVTGDGLKPILDDIKSKRPNVQIAAESIWETSATAVGKLAWHQFLDGKRDDLWSIQPLYFRPSAAEEIRNSKRLPQ